ncbi:MAG: lipid-binding SYLF domain-containing protein [Candidatus Wallbacteria bacterium]|nr:lipid-binding SYLF domain-containing protein [Candidatus Wallbacteria bacterium]
MAELLSSSCFKLCLCLFLLCLKGTLYAESTGEIRNREIVTSEIETRVDNSLLHFYDKVSGGRRLVKQAKAVLVFPRVYKVGVAFGLEYGEGAMRVDGKTIDYYSMSTASFGFQLGAEKKTVILLFMQEDIFKKIRSGNKWRAGLDASITVAGTGDGGPVNTDKVSPQILAYVIGRRGLMYSLSLEGTRFTKMEFPEKKP